MDLTTAIEKRRSVRKFLDKPVELATIGGILETAKHAPSSGNVQNWIIFVITDEEERKEIVKACAGQTWINTAPALLVICADTSYTKKYGKTSDKSSIQNIANITMLIMLKATEVGLGTCWIGSFDPNAVSKILQVPANIIPHVVLPMGYPHPDEKLKSHKRISIEKRTYFNKYGYAFRTAPKQKKKPLLKRIKKLIK